MLPVSLFFEVLLIILAFILREFGSIGKVGANGCIVFEFALIGATQQYLLDDGVTYATSNYPSAILGIMAFVFLILQLFFLEDWFYFSGRDVYGRRQ